MKDKLYPLVFKAGILRDGSPFQGEYCTDGQWVRWQRGRVRKIGGMSSYPIFASVDTIDYLHIFYVLNFKGNKVIFLMNGRLIESYIVNENDEIISKNNITGFLNHLSPTTLTQIIPIIVSPWNEEELKKAKPETLLSPGLRLVFFTANEYLTNIDTSTSPIIATTDVEFDQPLIKANILTNDNTEIIPTGGMVFSNPYLFFYGDNGAVWSSGTYNPFDFRNSKDNSLFEGQKFNISTDKVIYGAVIRGSTTNPTLLFWTLSSVIRINNTNADGAGKPIYNINTITKWASIMSSRCVVEYDGFFFWPGVDRFFNYNGQVQEMNNTLNLNYFFDNVDLAKRQYVFGVPNPRYGEIWWFYPEIKNKDTSIGCTRAVVYNIREDYWYDTAISREHALYNESDGVFYSFGLSLTEPFNVNSKYLFKHERKKPYEKLAGVNPYTSGNEYKRILGGTASSNSGDTINGEGGGVAANAFDNNPLTVYSSTVIGNISYVYSDEQIIRQIGLISTINQSIILTILASADLTNWQVLEGSQQYSLITGQYKGIEVNNDAESYKGYMLLSSDAPLTNISEIYLLINETSPTRRNLIFSYFTTPIFSFASFSPTKGSDGLDNFLELKRIEPDIVCDSSAKFNLIINSRIYAMSTTYSFPVITFTGGDPVINYRAQARQMSFTISSTDFFEMGSWFMLLNIGDGQ